MKAPGEYCFSKRVVNNFLSCIAGIILRACYELLLRGMRQGPRVSHNVLSDDPAVMALKAATAGAKGEKSPKHCNRASPKFITGS
jgi:hypothetical protein